MAEGIKREEAGRIVKKIKDCRFQLRKDNIYSCLLMFRDALEMTLKIPMLPADEKQVYKEINTFQTDMAASRAFRSLYGPVTFKDDDVATALDFMKQLILIKEEEIVTSMDAPAAAQTGEKETLQQRIDRIMVHVEREDVDTARKMADADEEAADALVDFYNAAGIESRKEGECGRAVLSFKKAIFIRPDDEGLCYNLARAYLEADDLKSARNAILEALRLDARFEEGTQLLKLIDRKMGA